MDHDRRGVIPDHLRAPYEPEYQRLNREPIPFRPTQQPAQTQRGRRPPTPEPPQAAPSPAQIEIARKVAAARRLAATAPTAAMQGTPSSSTAFPVEDHSPALAQPLPAGPQTPPNPEDALWMDQRRVDEAGEEDVYERVPSLDGMEEREVALFMGSTLVGTYASVRALREAAEPLLLSGECKIGDLAIFQRLPVVFGLVVG